MEPNQPVVNSASPVIIALWKHLYLLVALIFAAAALFFINGALGKIIHYVALGCVVGLVVAVILLNLCMWNVFISLVCLGVAIITFYLAVLVSHWENKETGTIFFFGFMAQVVFWTILYIQPRKDLGLHMFFTGCGLSQVVKVFPKSKWIVLSISTVFAIPVGILEYLLLFKQALEEEEEVLSVVMQQSTRRRLYRTRTYHTSSSLVPIPSLQRSASTSRLQLSDRISSLLPPALTSSLASTSSPASIPRVPPPAPSTTPILAATSSPASISSLLPPASTSTPSVPAPVSTSSLASNLSVLGAASASTQSSVATSSLSSITSLLPPVLTSTLSVLAPASASTRSLAAISTLSTITSVLPLASTSSLALTSSLSSTSTLALTSSLSSTLTLASTSSVPAPALASTLSSAATSSPSSISSQALSSISEEQFTLSMSLIRPRPSVSMPRSRGNLPRFAFSFPTSPHT